jgi:hypothetical protein
MIIFRFFAGIGAGVHLFFVALFIRYIVSYIRRKDWQTVAQLTSMALMSLIFSGIFLWITFV